jgi:hypothetical protein
MDPASSRNEEVTETGCEIMHLPSELLECILLKLSYAEIAQVRQVCRRFRNVADGILDREFRCLKARVESHLAALIQEKNALPGKGSSGGAETDSAVPQLPPQWDRYDSREFLNAICSEIRLLRTVCYRPLLLSEVPQNLRYHSAYFKGKIIDVTHRILRLVKSRWVEAEVVKVDLHTFVSLVDHWMYLVYKKVWPTSIQGICAQNTPKSEYPDLFGSMVIDLLEIIPECKKDITVNMDSGGWCYIKGEYKVQKLFVSKSPDGASALEPLTAIQQAELQYSLFHYARSRCLFHFLELNSRTVSFNQFLRWIYGVDCMMCHINGKPLTFKVDLKCRRELAPVELLLELLKEQSYESAPGAHTAEDPSPNLQLKLQIEVKGSSW